MLSSLSGILYVCDQAVAEPQTLGRGYELNAIAAAVVGGCSLQGGVGTVPGTMLGALFLRVVIDGVAKMIDAGAHVIEGLIVGVVVVFAVTFTRAGAAQTSRRNLCPEGGSGAGTDGRQSHAAGRCAGGTTWNQVHCRAVAAQRSLAIDVGDGGDVLAVVAGTLSLVVSTETPGGVGVGRADGD